MRDSHRLKEKYELSLDNRQIVSLTVASLVVLGGVFVLGVVVGKKLASDGVPEKTTADLLTAVDEKTAALDAVQRAKDASLTFQDELTKKFPVEVKLPVAAPVPVVAIAPEPKRPPEAQPAPEVKPEVVAAKSAAPAPTTLPDTPKEEAVATRTHDGGLKEAFGKAQKLPEPAPMPSAGGGAGTWALQLSAYQDRGEADRFAAGLRDKGYAPYIIEANVPTKGTWYRVRVGKFANKEAATNYLSDFKRETSMNGIVTPN
jgi:cell division septation protein DedD